MKAPDVLFVPQPGGWFAVVDLDAARAALRDPRWLVASMRAVPPLVCGYGHCRACPACDVPLEGDRCPRCGGTDSVPSKGWEAA